MRHVKEGDADVALDPLQLDLHLLAELEVEGAERPRSGSSKPAIMRSVAVLPEPNGPSSEKNSPRPTSTSADVAAVLVLEGSGESAARLGDGGTLPQRQL